MLGMGRLLRRRGSLLGFGIIHLIYGTSMLAADRSVTNTTLTWFNEIMPLHAWAVIWYAIGITCLVHAFRRNDGWGFAAAWMLMLFWAIMSLVGWIASNVTIGSVGIWFGLTWLLWNDSGWAEPDPTGEDG